MPKVSIVIPAFNSEKTIQKTLQSIQRQSYQDYEVLLCDDGSTDATMDIARTFAEHMDLSIHQIDHSGCPGRVRNAGIRKAKGEYIALIDSDDICLPHKLALEVELLEAHQDVSLVFTNFEQIIDDQPQGFGWLDQVHVKECMHRIQIEDIDNNKAKFKAPVPHLLLENNFIGTSTVMCRKKDFEEVGLFNDNYIGIEDRAMWVTLSMKGKLFGFITKICSEYLVRSDSVARSEKALRSHLKYYHDLEVSSEYSKYQSIVHQHLAKNYLQLMYRNRLNRQYGELIAHGFRVIRYGDLRLRFKAMMKILKIPFNLLKDLFKKE